MLPGKWRGDLTESIHQLLKFASSGCMKHTLVVIVKSIRQLLLYEIFALSRKKFVKLNSLLSSSNY